MGDNRQATRATGPRPDARKKDGAADTGGGGAVPEGAAADPRSALMALGAAHASTLLGMLQSAGGNAEVEELMRLESGRAVPAQAKHSQGHDPTRAAGLQSQVQALDAMTAGYAAALAAKQADIDACARHITALQQQIAEAAKADRVAALMAQMQTLLQHNQAIEAAIRSHQGLLSTLGAYREQTVLSIAPSQS